MIVCSDVQMVRTWSSWCHCHPIIYYYYYYYYCYAAQTLHQGSYRPWKVMELKCSDFQAWKVLEKGIGPGKHWKSPGILR